MSELPSDGCMVPMCEHYWSSCHQPDFPPPIYWIRICMLCGRIDGADLARELAVLNQRIN